MADRRQRRVEWGSTCGGCLFMLLLFAGLFTWLYIDERRAAIDRWTNRGAPVPSPTAQAPRPPFSGGLVWSFDELQGVLQSRVVATAGVRAPASTSCDSTTYRPRFTCTVTYRGRDVTYTITTTPRGGGSYEWESEPDRLVITREGIHASFWRSYDRIGTNLRCDPLPEVATVAPNTTLSQRCYWKPRDENLNHGKTASARVVVWDGGIRFTTEHQP